MVPHKFLKRIIQRPNQVIHKNSSDANIAALQDGEFFIRSTMDGSFGHDRSLTRLPFLSKDAVGEKDRILR